MAEPTLTQVFGANAAQDANTITIAKADLVAVGLTPASSNTAESLAVAIMLKASAYLNTTTQTTDNDIQVTIDNSNFPQLVTRNNATYRQTTFNVNLQTVDSEYTLDPDNF